MSGSLSVSFARRLYTSPFWVSGVVLLVAYSIAATVFPPRPVIEYMRVLNAASAAAVFIAFLGAALVESVSLRRSVTSYLIVGLAAVAFSAWGQALVGYIWRLAGQPSWIINNDVVGFLQAVGVWGYILHLWVPGVINGAPKRRQVVMGIVIGSVFAVFIGTSIFTPDFTSFLAFIRPYLDEGDRSGYGKSVNTQGTMIVRPLFMPPHDLSIRPEHI